MRIKAWIALAVCGFGGSACAPVVDDGYPNDVVLVGNPDRNFRECAASFGLPLFSIEDRYASADAAVACVDDADCFDIAEQTFEFYPDAPQFYDDPIVTPAYQLDSGRLADLRDLTRCHRQSYGF
jgi:hypothetical protein